jgi:hypothetical protein
MSPDLAAAVAVGKKIGIGLTRGELFPRCTPLPAVEAAHETHKDTNFLVTVGDGP